MIAAISIHGESKAESADLSSTLKLGEKGISVLGNSFLKKTIHGVRVVFT